MSYFSAANSAIILNGTEVGEAYGVEVTKDFGAVPVYGWNKRNWDFLAEGKVMVTGNLILNVSSGEYLQGILQGSNVSTSETQRLLFKAVQDGLDAVTRIQELIRLEGASGATILDVAREKKLLEELNRAALTNNPNDHNNVLSADANLGTMVIINNNNAAKEIVTGIRFTGKSFTYQSGSSQNIKYAFPFVARDASI